jgi:hypothetical protein
MRIDWVAVSTVLELVGVVVVIATLWYLALQIRLNTKALLTSTRQGLLDSDLALISDYITHAIDPHLIGDDVKLTPEDERRLTWIIIKAIRIREFAWHQYKSGLLDEDSWQSYMAPVPGIFSTKRGKAVLEFYTGDNEFMQVLKDKANAAQA